MFQLIKTNPLPLRRRVMKMQEIPNKLYQKKLSLFFLFLLCSIFSFAQHKIIPVTPQDSAISPNIIAVSKKENKDSKDTVTVKKDHSPRTAAIRSAILPGLGQIYNKKYWKVPIVYGALGTCAAVFFYNLGNYRDTRFAYQAKYKASLQPPFRDSTDYRKIKSNLLPLSLESLKFYRNGFRQDIDYSAIVFLVLWGLNVIDATVDAHLKSFDVSPGLGLRIKPGHSEMAGTNGISFVLEIR
jgi:Family of unknown function (DUF5683)